MAAETDVMVPGFIQQGEKIDLRNAPTRPRVDTRCHLRQEDHRLIEQLRQPGRHDADDAHVPPPAGQQQKAVLAALRLLGKALGQDALFLVPTGLIILVQRQGQAGRFFRVVLHQQLKGAVRVAHAPGGVEPRRDQIAQGGFGDGPIPRPGGCQQSGQAHLLADKGQAPGHQRPVAAHEGHHVRHRGHGHKGEVVLSPAILQGAGQEPGHPCAAKVAHPLPKIPIGHGDQSVRLRLLRPTAVVVRHDDCHAQGTSQGRLPQGGDAVIHSNKHVCANGRQPADSIFVETIALRMPGRDIAAHVRPQLLQTSKQNGRGADAIGVVVPVDADAFPVPDRLSDEVGGFCHALHLPPVGQGLRFGMEKGLDRFRRVQVPAQQSPNGHGRQSETGGKVRHQKGIVCGCIAANKVHGYYPFRLFVYLWHQIW